MDLFYAKSIEAGGEIAKKKKKKEIVVLLMGSLQVFCILSLSIIASETKLC